MKKQNNRIEKDLTFLVASMFVMVVFWIGFNAYHASITSTIVEPQQTTIIPINGRFDQQTISELQKRPTVQPDFENPLASTTQNAQPTPEPLSAETPQLLLEAAMPTEEPSSSDILIGPTTEVLP